MRVAIISDIHANLSALERVIADAMGFGPVDEVWCAGDIVGYGPDPNECVTALIDTHVVGTPVLAVAGNHDRAATGSLSTANFNAAARQAAQWTAAAIDGRSHSYLERLPEVRPAGEGDAFWLVHGHPRDPLWEYTTDARDALDCLRAFPSGHCIVGHTHVPALFGLEPGASRADGAEAVKEAFEHGSPVVLSSGSRYVINPGSVGQPRDHDPRAAYVLYERGADGADVLHLRRVEYDVEAVQARMRAARLPDILAGRLSYGW